MFRLRKILLLQLANFYLCASSNPLHAPSNMGLPLQYSCHFDFSERSVWTASRVYICAHQAVELFVSQTITGILSWTRAELEEYLWAQFSQVLLLSLLSNTFADLRMEISRNERFLVPDLIGRQTQRSSSVMVHWRHI